jgi:hypothetical protein
MRLAAAAAVVPAFFQTCLPSPPQVDPPEAVIEVTCLSPDCLVMELSGLASVDADDYQWFIDGVSYGTDDVIAIDVDTRDFVEVELVVGNSAGTDTDLQFLFTTEVTNDATAVNDDIMAAVVAGATACDSLAVISTVGGCFSNSGGAKLEHVVDRVRVGGGPARSIMVYDPLSDTVQTPGFAAAIVWERTSGSQQSLPSNVPYGIPPYRAVVGQGREHLTSYYPISTGEVLTFDLGHGAYYGDPAKRPLDTLTLDCTSGSLQVSATPVP